MIVSPDAQEELLAAAAWYEEQREGLGAELLDEEPHAVAFAHAKRRPAYRRDRI